MRPVEGSMRFSTAASGTSLTRTQIFKCGLLSGVLSGDSGRAGSAHGCVAVKVCGNTTALTDESIGDLDRISGTAARRASESSRASGPHGTADEVDRLL